MTKSDLQSIYRDYIACLNGQEWQKLHRFVHGQVKHNGYSLGLSGYQAMLEKDFSEIPDLYFDVQLLVADPPYLASRLNFSCTPKARFLNLNIDGAKVSFSENAFYEFKGEIIVQVWSVIDKAAIEAQLLSHGNV